MEKHSHLSPPALRFNFRLVAFVLSVAFFTLLHTFSPTSFYFAHAMPTSPSTERTTLSPVARHTLLRASFTVGQGKTHRRAVIVTAASHDVDQFASNLRCFVQQSSRKNMVLFALDGDMYARAVEMKVPSVKWFDERFPDEEDNDRAQPVRPTKVPHLFGSKAFSGITLSKLEIVRQTLLAGFDVIFSDVDTIWCQNMPTRFAELIRQYPQFDMFIQSNQNKENVIGQVNTGFYYAKRTPALLRMYSDLAKETDKWHNKSGDDQTLFWGFACKGGRDLGDGNGVKKFKDISGEDRFMCQWGDGTVSMMFLPIKEFPNGSADPQGRALVHIPKGYYRQMCKSKKVSMWHVNFCPGHAKQRRLREQDVWIVNDKGTCLKI